jgi:hypothetical protein
VIRYVYNQASCKARITKQVWKGSEERNWKRREGNEEKKLEKTRGQEKKWR